MGEDDRFILSKGHAAGALYVALWSKGLISEEQLRTFSRDGATLPGHPSGNGIPGLLFPTGSLGHGPSLASGLALAARFQRSTRHVWCLCSDGEWQEGSCWEALIFAVHHKLDNLTLLVDQNGLQAFGSTWEVVSISDLTSRFAAFGACAIRLDGHDQQAIIEAAKEKHEGKPHVLVLQTRKGRGTRLEGRMACHYLPLEASEYEELMGSFEGGA
jgi:transketolase